MARSLFWSRSSRRFVTKDVRALVAIVLALFFLTAGVEALFNLSVRPVRAITGFALVLFVPGVLWMHLLDVRTDSFAQFVMYVVGLSVSSVVLLAVVSSTSLLAIGVTAPLSLFPLTVALTVFLGGLIALVQYTDNTVQYPTLGSTEPLPAIVAVLLVVLSVIAALWMRILESNVGMFVFVLAVLAVVLLTTTRYITPSQYPLTIFGIALSTLLHRNLLTGHVIGADVQALYATSQLLVETGHWAPEMAGSSTSIPVVTLGPAIVATLTGVSTSTAFITTHVFLFALVPVGIYYLARELFDPQIALFGSLFFTFYHISFYFTPGKQLVAELFLVLILLALFQDRLSGTPGLVALALLSIGLIHSHYAVTYVFGSSLVVAAVGLVALRRRNETFERQLSVGYPLVLLFVATCWYWYGSAELFDTLISVPLSVVSQLLFLLTFTPIEGSGATYVQPQTTWLAHFRLAMYGLLTILLVIGLGRVTLLMGRRALSGESSPRASYTALALPLFAFLGASYFFVFNLWADRMYQLVLVVLAPFMPVGYVLLRDRSQQLFPGSWRRSGSQLRVVAVLLVVLFALNSGFAFALMGTATTSTFNPGANDLAFTDEEREGVSWLLENTEITRTDGYQPTTGTALAVDHPDRVQVYTDTTSAQLFRGVMPQSHYNVEVLHLKNQWEPVFDADRLDNGYVFVRHRAVAGADEAPSPSYISTGEREMILSSGEVVYENEAVTIVKISEDADP